jgi:general secretion pathway protein G
MMTLLVVLRVVSQNLPQTRVSRPRHRLVGSELVDRDIRRRIRHNQGISGVLVVGKFKWDIIIIFISIPLSAIVLGFLVALLWPGLSNSFSDKAAADRTKIETTRSKMMHLEESLELFKLDVGRYPTSTEGLMVLVKNVESIQNWNGPYYRGNLAGDPIDAWDQKFLYFFPSQFGGAGYDLYSVGPNGIDEHGLGDDIKAPFLSKIE